MFLAQSVVKKGKEKVLDTQFESSSLIRPHAAEEQQACTCDYKKPKNAPKPQVSSLDFMHLYSNINQSINQKWSGAKRRTQINGIVVPVEQNPWSRGSSQASD
jgi:hypothetical protein